MEGTLCPTRALPPFVYALREASVVSKPEDADGVLRIGTHDGSFHCDEALACAMLKMLPAYENAAIVRTRDPEALAKCDIVVDVGATYEPEKHRYDHHQRGFDSIMSEIGHSTKLSSAGLVYRHFGAEVVARLAAACVKGSPPDNQALYRKLYKSFMEHIDGIDNGVEAFAGGSRNYEVSTTLSARVGDLNLRWNEPTSPEDVNHRFGLAMTLTGCELATQVEELANSWWPARELVAKALDQASSVDPSRQILVLERACPWDAHLFQLEEELGVAGVAKYVLFPDAKAGDWRIQAVPVEEGSFTSRRALPEKWRGVRGEQLSELTGIDGCVFAHATGFIGGNKTREGVLEMARKAIA